MFRCSDTISFLSVFILGKFFCRDWVSVVMVSGAVTLFVVVDFPLSPFSIEFCGVEDRLLVRSLLVG